MKIYATQSSLRRSNSVMFILADSLFTVISTPRRPPIAVANSNGPTILWLLIVYLTHQSFFIPDNSPWCKYNVIHFTLVNPLLPFLAYFINTG